MSGVRAIFDFEQFQGGGQRQDARVAGGGQHNRSLPRESLKLGLISNRNATRTSDPIPSDAETRELLFQIHGMWCASCAWLRSEVKKTSAGTPPARAGGRAHSTLGSRWRVRWSQWVNPSAHLVSNITVHEGAGIDGEVADHQGFAGHLRLCPTPPDAALQDQVAAWERQGHTAIYVGVDGLVRAAVAFGDRIKPEAAAFVAELKRRGMHTLLVSGDARATTEWVAARLGVDEAIAEVLPGQKPGVVERLQRANATVAMIGDGVNDAPSLAQADLGIALASGADIAMRAAPVVITSGRLDPILDVFDWACRTVRIVLQNLFWAFLYNTAGISLAVSGLLHPIFAAGAMVLSSLSVTLNASRLSRTPALQASHETPNETSPLLSASKGE